MALTIKDGYTLHVLHIKQRLVKYTNRLISLSEEKKYLWSVIAQNEDTYKKAGIDLDNLVYGNRGDYDKRFIKKYKFSSNETLLQGYISAYFNILRLEKVCIDSIRQYSLLNIPFTFYKYAVTELNLEYSKEVLKGHAMELGSGLGTINIYAKARDFTKEGTCKAVNWNKSKKVKQALLDAGEIPYDKNTAPDGVKWQVKFDDDVSYWWWWKFQIGYTNYHYYKFIPTKFINGLARDVKNFFKNFDTVEKILDSREVGNIDKLYRIKQLFPAYMNNYTTVKPCN